LPAPSPITIIFAGLWVYLLMARGAALRKIGVLKREHDIGVMLVSGGKGIPWKRLVNGPIITYGVRFLELTPLSP
jgi:hypothetical protein